MKSRFLPMLLVPLYACIRLVAADPEPAPSKEVIETEGGYQITLDTTDTPDLTEWAHSKLAPVIKEWYPKIVKLLPSEGFEAPKTPSVTFSKDMRGVAATGGTKIRCAAEWFRKNLEGEARGAVFHELVHVVQQYGAIRREKPDSPRPPGWLVEGIPDYIRWYIYEPESHGAEITRRNFSRAKYDGSYRITANFLHWVTEKYGLAIIPELNGLLRTAKYTEEFWKQKTQHTVQELGEEWRSTIEKTLPPEAPPKPNK
jgi:hypothetical protein